MPIFYMLGAIVVSWVLPILGYVFLTRTRTYRGQSKQFDVYGLSKIMLPVEVKLHAMSEGAFFLDGARDIWPTIASVGETDLYVIAEDALPPGEWELSGPKRIRVIITSSVASSIFRFLPAPEQKKRIARVCLVAMVLLSGLSLVILSPIISYFL